MSLRRSRPTILVSLSLLGAVLVAQAQQAPAPADNLNLRYANGIVAIAEDKVITVDDVRREIGPLVAEIQQTSRSEQEFNEKLEALQEDVIQNLIDRVLIVKEFYKDEKRKVPARTLVVRTSQRLGTLASYLLEPQAEDGLTAWNAFDPLVAGKDFPVVRLPGEAKLVTRPLPPLAEDR